ncbi:DUF2628 domain-containing protein [Burkholderia anthina]|uniref:Peptide ABC transporter permease n=1 Tax=Burkholderia anthina TaxID=179879 RepID=A0AAW3Q2S0_9BURK|nr:DUF2628 domain-containing protein [Burkholderia anthina]KWZ36054.1 peptide ABC transporter permease [Burkholderia anthina]
MSETTTPVSTDEIAAYVGKKARWYETKWAIAATRRSKHSWNWAAFLVGPFWMAYRGMYWHALALFGIVFGLSLIEMLFFPNFFDSSQSNAIGIGISVILGLHGNSFYQAHVRRAITRLRPHSAPGDSFLALLSVQGGTNWLAVIGFAVAFVFFCYATSLIHALVAAFR